MNFLCQEGFGLSYSILSILVQCYCNTASFTALPDFHTRQMHPHVCILNHLNPTNLRGLPLFQVVQLDIPPIPERSLMGQGQPFFERQG